MFKRKLQALDYPALNNLNINNDKEFRSVVCWLEDQKIRHYKIEDRANLRKIEENDEWENAYKKYKTDLSCPISTGKRTEELEWILGYAIRLEYADNTEKYNKTIEPAKVNTPNIVTSNPLDNLDFNSSEFIKGVNDIAKILKISPHPNHLVTLEAARKIITKRLSPEALQNPNSIIHKGNPYPFEEVDAGFKLKDPLTNKAAKIMRLIYIQSLRNLQTSANELIVAVQNVTANPKTDTKLGKVGK